MDRGNQLVHQVDEVDGVGEFDGGDDLAANDTTMM